MTSSLRPSEFSKEGGVTTPVAPGKVTRLTGPPVGQRCESCAVTGQDGPACSRAAGHRPALVTRLSAEAECRASWYHLCRPPRRPGPTAAALALPHGARPPCAAAPPGAPTVLDPRPFLTVASTSPGPQGSTSLKSLFPRLTAMCPAVNRLPETTFPNSPSAPALVSPTAGCEGPPETCPRHETTSRCPGQSPGSSRPPESRLGP